MDLDTGLHQYFGFRDFRRGQREACAAAAEGRDVLVVMPTGSGKSLCYQLPALLRDDLTIVVSPLVALMQDQVDALRARGLGDRVAVINAQQDSAANSDVLGAAERGELELAGSETFDSSVWFKRTRGKFVLGYGSDPRGMVEMGFPGPSYRPGHIWLDRGEVQARTRRRRGYLQL